MESNTHIPSFYTNVGGDVPVPVEVPVPVLAPVPVEVPVLASERTQFPSEPFVEPALVCSGVHGAAFFSVTTTQFPSEPFVEPAWVCSGVHGALEFSVVVPPLVLVCSVSA